jgi:hypothetical protein
MRRGRSKRRLPDSLTKHLSDPKILALKPRTSWQSLYRASGSAEKFALSAMTLIIIVLASGHLLHAW